MRTTSCTGRRAARLRYRTSCCCAVGTPPVGARARRVPARATRRPPDVQAAGRLVAGGPGAAVMACRRGSRHGRIASGRRPVVNLPTSPTLVPSVLTAERDYAALYRAVAPPLWRAIFAYTGGLRDLADDAVAEAFARAIQHDGTIRQPHSWLYRTAFRIAAAELRRRRSQAEIGEYPYEQRQDLAEVLLALRRLTPSQRAGRLPPLPGRPTGARRRPADGDIRGRGQGPSTSRQGTVTRAPGDGGNER